MLEMHILKKMDGFKLQIDLECDEGRVGILGVSGAGKSMILKCIAGIMTPDEGYITIDERVLYDSGKKINVPAQERNCGYLFQNYALFPHMSVLDNIMSGIRKKNIENRRRIAHEYIERFRLGGLQDQLPYTLSGGQQQRVAFARMMAAEPSIILLDEPYSALDGYLKEKMQSELSYFLKNFKGLVVMVSHNRDEIYRFSDRILVLSDGHQIECNITQEIFHNPKRMETARLTGCSNITKIEKRGKYEVYVPSWKLSLMTEIEVTEDIRYIGIRSHDLREGNKNDKNTYQMQIYTENHAPFEFRYGIMAVQELHQDTDSIIWWKENKNLDTAQIMREFPCYITFPSNKILLFKE